MKNPKAGAWFGFVITIILMGLAIFLSAGTIQYWQAWLFLGVVVVTSIPITLYITNDPILLENRTRGGPTEEHRPIQKIIVWALGVPLIATFIVPGFDHRFVWSSAPSWVPIMGDLIIILSMWMVYRVFKENSFGSASIEVTKDQKVVSTGPYAIVRNPMYSCAILYFIGISLALGSYWGLVPVVLLALGFVWRLFDEEKFLALNLSGYTEYQAKVHWHLIPGIF